MQFEYCTTFIEFPHNEGQQREKVGTGWLSPLNEIHASPAIEEFMSKQDNQQHMNDMGNKGWELVAVEQILRGILRGSGDPKGGMVGYSLTAGFILFWKRRKGGTEQA